MAPMLESANWTVVKVAWNTPPRKLMAVAPAGRELKVMLVMERPVKVWPAVPCVVRLRP